MKPNPINDEIRAVRRDLAARQGNDVGRIFAELVQGSGTGDRKWVSFPPRRQEGEAVAPQMLPITGEGNSHDSRSGSAIG